MKEKEIVNLLCIVAKLDEHENFKDNLFDFARSVLEKSSVPIALSVITDERSRTLAKEIIDDAQGVKRFHEVVYFDVSAIVEKLKRIVSIMSPHFSSKRGTYYSDPLFYLSLGLHHIFRPDLHKVLMADVDMKFVGDIAELWAEFYKFNSKAILGIAPELAPTYMHAFHSYRTSNPDTKIGEPFIEDGYPGFNSGILLLNLDRMRQSKILAKFIGEDITGNPEDTEEIKELEEEVNGRVTSVGNLVKKYSFVSNFGDQDFYTLLGVEYPELLHVIPCNWNQQLCIGWGEQEAYIDVFDRYFRCDGEVKVYHGNCNSPIPFLNE
ncbi:xyloside xylosyltransferase 1-like [Hetaerina americana]|uniref:xyloside xylosyltransferase 1-like n=1 Tax=Hetaerina americana TaxID=62018 RepID=UPI003A7F5005